jgi:hypothetical protein
MNENLEEETTIKNRLALREVILRKLTSKYLELVSKFNLLTRNEMAQHIRDIMNEVDLLEISVLKAENFDKLKEIDNAYQESLQNQICKIYLI